MSNNALLALRNKRIGYLSVADATAALTATSGANNSPLLGIPITDNCYSTGATGATSTTGTSEAPYTVLVSATDLRLVFANQSYDGTADVANAATITIKAAIRIGASIYPCTFRGASSFVLAGGGVVQTDPLPLQVLAGTVIYPRCEVTPTTSWYATRQAQFATGTGGWTTTVGLCVAGAATIAETATSALYMPSQIIGRPLVDLATGVAPTPRVVLITGDSRAAGSNDTSSSRVGRSTVSSSLSGGGYVARALYEALIPSINSAASSDRATYAVAAYGRNLRWAWASVATTTICAYGINDITNGRSLAQLQGNLITLWVERARLGQRTIQDTVMPLSISSDGWLTVANQSVSNAGKEAIRVSVNEWLRDGAPLVSATTLTPIAVGAVGLRAGQAGHPLYTTWDCCVVCESSLNSGSWAVLSGRTLASASISSSSATFNCATGSFTAADLGSLVTVVGAGAAGANLTATIITINTGAQVVLSATASTTVSGAAAYVDHATTRDGIHPSGPIATLMAAAIDVDQII